MTGFELSLPSPSAWSNLARAMIAAGAVPLNLDVDRLDDLLIVTDHVFEELTQAPGAGSLTVTLEADEEELRVRLAGNGPQPAPSPLDGLLSRLTDGFQTWSGESSFGVDLVFTARTKR